MMKTTTKKKFKKQEEIRLVQVLWRGSIGKDAKENNTKRINKQQKNQQKC